MYRQRVSFLWRSPQAPAGYTTAVALHGHTMHSEECLNFLPRHLSAVPFLAHLVRRHQSSGIDFNRAWWTPPLSPAAALDIERNQIAAYSLTPVVSLTDHDKIDAGLTLQVSHSRARVPVSAEWTVRFEGSIFHLGIHNLPAGSDVAMMRAMAACTSDPQPAVLRELLADLHATPGVLIVLNHPFWLEEGVTESVHERALPLFLAEFLPWLDAFELNGTRKWPENQRAIELARNYAKPAISGGDRHACEPAACLNLTNARSFTDFAAEIKDGCSNILFMAQYRESMAVRVLETAWDILKPYPEYPDREHWADRIYYRGDDGVARTLSEISGGRPPRLLDFAVSLVELVAYGPLRSAVRAVAIKRGEVLP